MMEFKDYRKFEVKINGKSVEDIRAIDPDHAVEKAIDQLGIVSVDSVDVTEHYTDNMPDRVKIEG